MRKIAHLSDLHFGKTDSAVVKAVIDEVNALKPDVVVISGDLTQRAHSTQFQEAKRFLQALPHPQLIVPGNHDIPLYNLPVRVSNPYGKFKKFISTDLEPIIEDDQLLLVGINSSHPARATQGWLRPARLQKLTRRLNSPESRGKIKILVSHHPLSQGNLEKLHHWGMQVDLVLAGHLHRSGATISKKGGIQIVQAGTSTSTRHRGETNSMNLILIEGRNIEVVHKLWTHGQWTDGLF